MPRIKPSLPIELGPLQPLGGAKLVPGRGEQRDRASRQEDGVAGPRHVRLRARTELEGQDHTGKRERILRHQKGYWKLAIACTG